MKFARWIIPCILLFTLLPCEAMAQSPAVRPQVTFAQLTDAHLFDDDESVDFSALAWSVATINRLAAAGTPIDFVVYTGDLGLRNVAFPSGLCENAPLESRMASEPRPLAQALDGLTEVLDRLSVRKLYFVPGNNDLTEERLGDMGRYQCFLSQLQAQVDKRAKEKQNPIQPLKVAALEPDSTFVAGGIRILGLNDASLKDQNNYQPWCSERPEAAASSLVWDACPQEQVERLSRSLRPGKPAVVFTHIPYLKDPYPPRALELPGAWDITQALRSGWEQAACQNNVIAIFAGHFHDSNRDLYGARGRRTLQLTECVSNKSWVAPPLAQKFQGGRDPQARGFLVVTMTPSDVTDCTIYWLNGTTSSCR